MPTGRDARKIMDRPGPADTGPNGKADFTSRQAKGTCRKARATTTEQHAQTHTCAGGRAGHFRAPRQHYGS